MDEKLCCSLCERVEGKKEFFSFGHESVCVECAQEMVVRTLRMHSEALAKIAAYAVKASATKKDPLGLHEAMSTDIQEYAPTSGPLTIEGLLKKMMSRLFEAGSDTAQEEVRERLESAQTDLQAAQEEVDALQARISRNEAIEGLRISVDAAVGKSVSSDSV